jgi:hypothetical protein
MVLSLGLTELGPPIFHAKHSELQYPKFLAGCEELVGVRPSPGAATSSAEVRWIIHQPSSRRTLLQPGTAALRFGCGFAAPHLCASRSRVSGVALKFYHGCEVKS